MSHQDKFDDTEQCESNVPAEIANHAQQKSLTLFLLIRIKDRIGKFFDDVVWPFIGACLLIGFSIWAIWWFYYSFFSAPTIHEASPPQIAVLAVQSELAISVPNASPRLEFFKGNNLEIFISLREFEDIPFPDRERTIHSICLAWSKKVDHTYLPSVKIRDIRTGNILAEYSCFRDSLSLQEIK